MKTKIKSLLWIVPGLSLLATVLCTVILLVNTSQTPAAPTNTTTALPPVTTTVPAVTTTAPTVPTTTVPPVTTTAPTVPTTTVPPVTTTAPTVPTTTVPPVTTTAPTVPTTTVPLVTTTAPTVPTTTVPATTIPVTTVPATTIPVTTAPVTTVPATTPPATTVPVTTAPVPVTNLNARNAFVYFCGEDRLVCAKGQMDTRFHPASITKLFTIYTAYQYLDPAQPITVGNIILSVPEDSSFAYLEIGDVLTLEDLTAAMLLPSGNDAAMVMAVAAGRIISGDPSQAEKAALNTFMDEMNRQTEVLGLLNSHFSCPDGYYNQNHYTCMADLITISKLCLAIPEVRRITAMPEYTFTRPDGRTLTWKSTNHLLREEGAYYNPYAIGLKTGYTNAAGNCLLSAFHVDGQDIIIGVFGCSSIQERFRDTLKLFDEFA